MDEAILQFFENIRNPVLTQIFGFFSLLGEAGALTAATLMLYWLFPKLGEQVLYPVLTGLYFNAELKAVVRRPRPYLSGAVSKLDPPLSSSLDGNASFPSGHTQAVTGFFGALALFFKRALFFALFGALPVLVALSRVYFGVHYPSDVLAGLLFGLLVVLFWAIVFRRFFAYRELVLLLFAALSFLPLFFAPSKDAVQAAGLLSGGAAGLVLLKFCGDAAPAPFPERLWRIPVGGAVLLVVYLAFSVFPESSGIFLLKWFFLALYAGLGVNLVFQRLQI